MPQIPIHLVPFDFSNFNFIVTLWVYYMHMHVWYYMHLHRPKGVRTARGLTINFELNSHIETFSETDVNVTLTFTYTFAINDTLMKQPSDPQHWKLKNSMIAYVNNFNTEHKIKKK